MKCFYHSADLDGHCSGAIVKYFNPDCEMIGINYGQEFPWESILPDETVFMVDFTLQPFDGMERLKKISNLIWIDHHKTEIENAAQRDFHCNGLQLIGKGACWLTWEYCMECEYTDQDIPLAVQLLAEYDVWNHSRPETLPFQYGFRMFPDTLPDNQELWGKFFSILVMLTDTVERGELILEYEKQQNEKFCKAYAFETLMPAYPDNGHVPPTAFNAICVNRGFTNSKLFDSNYDPQKYHLMITFQRLKLPAQKWTVSLYSTRDDVDCGNIARSFGGGGHKGAAGFQCEELPFLY